MEIRLPAEGAGDTRPSPGAERFPCRGPVVKARARAAARIDQSRSVVMEGLTPQQYAEIVQTLAAMAGNVEAALAARRA